MNRNDSPKKQPVPFAVNGQRENLLPSTPAGDNTASYSDGFPPVTMILKAAGGLPPKGQDMNQVLFELSALGRWTSSGAINTFDQSFSTSIGGYPKGAMLIGDDAETPFLSTIDANNNNPNSSQTGWLSLAKIISVASLPGGANKIPYFTGTSSTAQTDLTQVGRDILGKNSIAEVNNYLQIPQTYAPRTYVDANFVTKVYADANYATRTYVDSNFATRTYVDNNYASINYVNNGFLTIAAAGATYATRDYVNNNFAQLNSPPLTGTPTTPTPPVGTYNFQIASTAFVTNQINSMFTSLQSANGWQKLSGGIILQWGTTSCANRATTTITYPIPFPNACLLFNSSGYQSSGGQNATTTVNNGDRFATNGNAFLAGTLADADAVRFKWIAIGY